MGATIQDQQKIWMHAFLNIKMGHTLTRTHLSVDPFNLYGVKLLKRIRKLFSGSTGLKAGAVQKKKLLFAATSKAFTKS